MIPKKIHYCWFGGNPMPALALRCMESWVKHSPEYELVRWDESNSDINNEYCQQAIRQKNWAFISDWVRFDVLHRHGGVYLDTDVELIRPLSVLLDDDAFYAAWESPGILGSAFIACPQGDLILGRARELILKNLIPIKKFATSPRLLMRAIDDTAGESKRITLPAPYFFPFNPFDDANPKNAGQLLFSDIAPETIGIHHYSASWHFKRRIRFISFLQDKLKRRPDWRLTIDF